MSTKYREIVCPNGRTTMKNPTRFSKNEDATVNTIHCRNNCVDYKNNCSHWKKKRGY